MTGTGRDTDADSNGVWYSHAYSILDTYELSDGTRLIKMRNPHAGLNQVGEETREKYSGPWCHGDWRWNATNKAEAGYIDDVQDGIFHINVEEYMKSF